MIRGDTDQKIYSNLYLMLLYQRITFEFSRRAMDSSSHTRWGELITLLKFWHGKLSTERYIRFSYLLVCCLASKFGTCK